MIKKTLSEQVFEEQIILLYTKSPVRPLLHIIPGTIIFWMAVHYTGIVHAGVWLLLLVGINLLRFINIRSVRKNIKCITDYRKHSRIFILGTCVVGVTYGAGIASFLQFLPELLELAILSVAVTVIPGAMVSYSTSKPAFILYLFPKMLLPMVMGLFIGDSFHNYVFLYGMVYIIILLTLFHWYYGALTETIHIRLENAALLDTLRDSNRLLAELSTIDGLTGVANRRHFDELLEKESLRARREHKPISLLMLDIDYFKQFNDEYGHTGGDECLKKISQTLQLKTRRPADSVARYGGEEFCIIMPDTDKAGALQFAMEVHSEIEKLAISHDKSRITDHVTVSIGVATASPDKETNAKHLINLTDKALYDAKKSGRNLVKVAGEYTDSNTGSDNSA